MSCFPAPGARCEQGKPHPRSFGRPVAHEMSDISAAHLCLAASIAHILRFLCAHSQKRALRRLGLRSKRLGGIHHDMWLSRSLKHLLHCLQQL